MLNTLIGIRVNDGAAALGPVYQCDVLLNTVIGLDLESPPVGP